MKRILIFSLTFLLILSLTACGKGEEAETTPPTTMDTTGMELALVDWTMNATTWSSPNGATVNIAAKPTFHKESHCAEFMVILNREEVFRKACAWDGTYYTCSADLNAANGYGYYMVLTDTDGTEIVIAVNTVESPIDETLIHMESALNAYADLVVESSTVKGSKLSIDSGYANIQLTSITQQTPVTIEKADLVLTYEGAEADRQSLDLPQAKTPGYYEVPIKNVSLKFPKMEDDQRLSLQLEVTSSDGQIITAPGGNWYYNAGELLSALG